MTFAIIGLIVLILLSAFFSGSETAMMAINRYRTQHKANEGIRSARRILRLLKRTDRLLGIILIGNTFANVLASSLATIIALHYWGDSIVLISSIALTFILLIFAEVTPKTLAAIHSDRYASIVSLPLKYLLLIAYPLVWLINMIANNLLKLIGVKPKHHAVEALNHDELRSAVIGAAKTVSLQDREMLLSIFDLKHASVNDVMVPRNNIMGIDLDDELGDIKEQVRGMQHTRVPLYQGNIDNISGVLHLRDAVRLIAQKDFNKSKLIKASHKPYFIPEKISLVQQLFRFQKHQRRLAFVVDEYGKVEGLIKLDDILEEVVGEFTTDAVEFNKMISKQKDGSFLVDGAISIRDLNRDLNLNLPIDEAVTLNGLIIEHLESIPKSQTSLTIENCQMEVMMVKHNQVKTVRILAN